MNKLYTGLIDLNKINNTKVITIGKNGQPFKNGAKYVKVSIWVNDTPDQYGNSVSIQTGGKEDKAYIGNAKEYVKKESVQAQQQTFSDDTNDLPF